MAGAHCTSSAFRDEPYWMLKVIWSFVRHCCCHRKGVYSSWRSQLQCLLKHQITFSIGHGSSLAANVNLFFDNVANHISVGRFRILSLQLNLLRYETVLISKIWGSHSSEYEGGCFLGYGTMYSGWSLPVLQSSLLPPLSGWLIYLPCEFYRIIQSRVVNFKYLATAVTNQN
jgi:hypothetical protein